MIESNLVQAVQAMGELYGNQISPAAARMFLKDLAAFPENQIDQALQRCRMELTRFPSIADVIARIADTRPGPDEAWAMIPKDEEGSVIWSEEMAEAFGKARPLLLEGDHVAGRLAFRETYVRLVSEARRMKRQPRWSPSFGFSKQGRFAAVSAALDNGRITPGRAQKLLEGEGPIPPNIQRIVDRVTKALP